MWLDGSGSLQVVVLLVLGLDGGMAQFSAKLNIFGLFLHEFVDRDTVLCSYNVYSLLEIRTIFFPKAVKI